MEVYASRSRTHSGWLAAMTLTNELKHTTHCWMVVIFLGSLGLSLLDIKSIRVTSGAPKRHGSSSLSLMNSPFLIFNYIKVSTKLVWFSCRRLRNVAWDMLKAALLILRPLLPSSLTCLRRRLLFALKDVNNSAFDVVCVTCHLSSSCVAANWQ